MTDKTNTEKAKPIRSKSKVGTTEPVKPKSLSDVRDELGLERTPYKIAELVGLDITVTSIRSWSGRFGQCFTINFILDDEPCFCVTGATVVTQKLTEVEVHFPLVCVIIKEEEYYDVT